jgi:uncharacterized membrane protein
VKKRIKQISDQPPVTLKQGGGKSTKKKNQNRKVETLFSTLTLRELTDTEKDRLKIKAKSLLKRMRSKAPEDRVKNELFLRQIIAYLSMEFDKVSLNFKVNF